MERFARAHGHSTPQMAGHFAKKVSQSVTQTDRRGRKGGMEWNGTMGRSVGCVRVCVCVYVLEIEAKSKKAARQSNLLVIPPPSPKCNLTNKQQNKPNKQTNKNTTTTSINKQTNNQNQPATKSPPSLHQQNKPPKQIGARRLVMTHFSPRYKGDLSPESLSIMRRLEEMARRVSA